jgi:tripartite-type tricarboxylate transporter receptor subunit TctC
MIGGQIDAGFETTSVVLGHLGEHSIKALAVIREQRLPELLDAPTMFEGGVPALRGSSCAGVLAPLGTPQRSSRGCATRSSPASGRPR